MTECTRRVSRLFHLTKGLEWLEHLTNIEYLLHVTSRLMSEISRNKQIDGGFTR